MKKINIHFIFKDIKIEILCQVKRGGLLVKIIVAENFTIYVSKFLEKNI